MHLSPREFDKLLIHQVGSVAQKRLARGLQLNYTEAVALIASQLLEFIRDGRHSVSDLMSIGKQILGRRHVLPGVEQVLHEIQIEGTFLDGTKLVTVHDPICTNDGNLEYALYGSFLPVPSLERFPLIHSMVIPGQLDTGKGDLILNQGRPRCNLVVVNDGDRPIQVGSHYHFIETNRLLRFDRKLSYGMRLDIPAGTAVRFEPGERKTVSLVACAGNRVISGGNRLASGHVNINKIDGIVSDLVGNGYLHETQLETFTPSPRTMTRFAYAQAYGPTVGDRMRLGDTNLWLEIEKDYAIYGDECVFGGGKVIREGMGQSTFARNELALDLVITNAVIIDYHGIIKADIGIKNGMIVGVGKAGNPDIMDGVSANMVIGATTEVLSAEGKIITAGALDTHVHYICPQLCIEALSSGITTLVGGGTGPNTGTCATTCTPGKRYIQFMLQATDDIPLNFGFTGKGNCSDPEPLREQIRAGAVGLKLHEDWGTSPSAIDCCLSVCDEEDVQATIHTDTLNESGFVEDTIAALKGRTIHAYHSEGAGGGHAPDIIKVCAVKNVIPSSTNPTRPFTKNTIDEHLDMLLVCHHLDKNIPEDIAFAESRIREETIAAEDVLHDIGAISVISSDSQAMGRIGEVICRTWQTADKMKKLSPVADIGDGLEKSVADNFRIKRYIAKYTINPAIAHGLSHLVGSVEAGKLADLVLWEPAFFGTKPDKVLKGGMIAWSQMGDANASIPTPQPVIGRPMFASFPSSFADYAKSSESDKMPISVAFVSQSSLKSGTIAQYHLKKRAVAIKNCRNIGKMDMKMNNSLPSLRVDPETYEVEINGKVYPVPAAETVPLSRNFYIF